MEWPASKGCLFLVDLGDRSAGPSVTCTATSSQRLPPGSCQSSLELLTLKVDKGYCRWPKPGHVCAVATRRTLPYSIQFPTVAPYRLAPPPLWAFSFLAAVTNLEQVSGAVQLPRAEGTTRVFTQSVREPPGSAREAARYREVRWHHRHLGFIVQT
jgi:hypothetical protein